MDSSTRIEKRATSHSPPDSPSPSAFLDGPEVATAPHDQQRTGFQLLLIASAFIVPIVFLPYLPLRRRLDAIYGEVASLKALQDKSFKLSHLKEASTTERNAGVIEALKNDLSRHKNKSGIRLGETAQGVSALQKALASEQQMRIQAQGDAHALKVDLQNLSTKFRALEKVQREVMIAHARVDRQTLEDLAASLVDVAAFMEEVETLEGLERRGHDPRGVERMRQLALKLHASRSDETS